MRRHLAALGAATILAGGLAACSSGAGTEADVESDPSSALREAVNALSEFSGVEATLSLDGDASALAEDMGDERTAELVLGSSITVRATGETEEDAQVQLVVDIDGAEAVDVRYLPEERLYFRVDLDAIRAAADDPDFDSSVDEAVSGAQMFGAGELANAVVAGEWVQLTGISQLMEMAEGMAGAEQPTDEEAEALADKLVGALDRFLDEDVEVAYVGSEDAGEHVRATTDGAALQELLEELTAIAAEAGGAGAAPPVDEGIDPDEEIIVDAWIADGALSQVGIDLAAYDDEVPAGTFLLIAIADFDGDIEQPEAATEFDLFGLLGGAMGGMMGDLEGLGEMPGELPDDGGVDDAAGDDAGELPDDGAEDGAGDDAGDLGCIPQEEIDSMLDSGMLTEEDLQELEELGALEIC